MGRVCVWPAFFKVLPWKDIIFWQLQKYLTPEVCKMWHVFFRKQGFNILQLSVELNISSLLTCETQSHTIPGLRMDLEHRLATPQS